MSPAIEGNKWWPQSIDGHQSCGCGPLKTGASRGGAVCDCVIGFLAIAAAPNYELSTRSRVAANNYAHNSLGMRLASQK